MKNLSLFLSSLNDKELILFYKYRFYEFMPDSQKEIINEFQKRKLNIKCLNTNSVVQIFTKNKEIWICPRCGCSKYYKQTRLITKSISIATYEVPKINTMCLICGYDEIKDSLLLIKLLKLKQSIRKFFSFN